MSKKIHQVDPYDATPDQMLAMLQDPDYASAKYQALGDLETKFVQHEATDGGMELNVDRTVPADLPDFAKKILGDTNALVQKESWSRSGQGYVCEAEMDFPGKPLKMTGRYVIAPDGDAKSTWTVDLEIKASIPLVGGKLEGVVEKETRANLAKEFDFNKEWLASH